MIPLMSAELAGIAAGMREFVNRGDLDYLVECANDGAVCLIKDEMLFAEKNDSAYQKFILWFCKNYGIQLRL